MAFFYQPAHRIESIDLRARVTRSDLVLDRSIFQIRVGNNTARTSALADRMFSSRGYWGSAHRTSHLARRTILEVCNASTVFGTVSLCFDSGARLPADAIYSIEIDRYRERNHEVAQVARLAIDPEFGSKEMLGALFHVAYIGLRVRQVADVFIEVNPRHVSFYERMLGFRVAGECRTCPRVDAPGVLLHLEMGVVTERIATHRNGRSRTRSLYRYFCSPEEERDIVNRVTEFTRLDAARQLTSATY